MGRREAAPSDRGLGIFVEENGRVSFFLSQGAHIGSRKLEEYRVLSKQSFGHIWKQKIF